MSISLYICMCIHTYMYIHISCLYVHMYVCNPCLYLTCVPQICTYTHMSVYVHICVLTALCAVGPGFTWHLTAYDYFVYACACIYVCTLMNSSMSPTAGT